MTKNELINQVAHATGQQKKDVEDVIEATMSVIKRNMAEGRNVYLRGFGSFIVKRRAEKPAWNITARTPVIVPAHSIPFFKPCKRFINSVKNNVK
jgi:DNA-binding protein HU-beta